MTIHVTVPTIEESVRWAREHLDDKVSFGELPEHIIIAKHQTTREVDGTPNVYYELAEFCDELRKHFKGIRFGHRRGYYSRENVGFTRLHSLWAYYPGQEYALGKVGFELDKGRYKYTLYARTITNNKFSAGSDGYNTVSTEHMDKAVKNAKKYLRAYGTLELANRSVTNLAGGFLDVYNKVTNRVRVAQEEFVAHRAFEREMRRLLTTSHEFIDASFKLALTDYLNAMEEREQRRNAPTGGRFIHIREEAGEQVFDMVHTPDVRRLNLSHASTSVTTTKLDEMDEALIHKIASLSMLDDDGFVEGLGMKVNDKMYWVLV